MFYSSLVVFSRGFTDTVSPIGPILSTPSAGAGPGVGCNMCIRTKAYILVSNQTNALPCRMRDIAGHYLFQAIIQALTHGEGREGNKFTGIHHARSNL